MEKFRDLLIFIIIAGICFFIWNNQPKKEPEKKSVQQQQKTITPDVKDKAYKLTYNFIIHFSNPNAKTATLTIPIPVTDNSKQKISSVKYSHKPLKIYTSDDSQYAKIQFIRPKTNKIEVTMTVECLLHKYDYKTAAYFKRNYEKLSNKSRYLKAEKNIEVYSQTIKSAASSIKGQSQIEILTNINNYLTQKVKMVDASKTIGAEKSLKNGSAAITDFVNIFVALSRAKGIPARVVSGYIIGKGGGSSRHAWAEVYFQESGWVIFDIINNAVDITELNAFYIKSSNNSFLADTLETTFDNTPTSGRVETYIIVNAAK